MGEWERAERWHTTSDGDTPGRWTLARGLSVEGEPHDQTLFALSDGWLGVRACLEERPADGGGAFIADGYEHREIDYHERFPGFARKTDTRMPVADGKRVVVRLGDAREDLSDGEVLSGGRALDLASGRLRRNTEWRARSGARLKVQSERVACFRRPGLYPLRFTLESIDFDGPVELDAIIDLDAQAAGKSDDPRIGVAAGALPFRGWREHGDVHVAVQALATRGLVVLCGQRVLGDGAAVKAHPAGRTLSLRLSPGQRVTIEKRVAYAVCADEEAAIAAAAEALAARLADGTGFDELAAEQADEWRVFWDAAAVAIEGAPELELGLRLNLFHLRQAADASGRNGLAAKGLSGEGYEGHVFWDAEVFMLPVLVHSQPELARAHLAYRRRHLDAARRHAREMNFQRGALIPWRTIGGDECSAYFPAGSAQLHINAAVAYAIGAYLDATQDFDFVAEQAELLFETARVWLEAGAFDARRDGAFEICAVTGPDEYTALVDNNWYTNRMARAHLELAGEVADRLQAERPQAYAILAARIGLTDDERATWAAAAEAMHLPYDRNLGVHPQDDRFLSRPRFDFAAAEGRRPLLLHYHPLTLYRTQVCKQADLILALVLKGQGIPLEQKRRDYDYYEPLTTHDSTLSGAIFSVLAAEVNAPDEALRFFREATLVDLENRHANTHHGSHLAAMSGSWLALVWGFAGLRTHAGRPAFRPILPKGLDGYSARIQWRGSIINLRVEPTRVEYRLVSGSSTEIEHEGERLRLTPGAAVLRPWGHAAKLEAVIFDLDGVITDTAKAHYRAWKRLADEIGAPFDEEANEQLKGVGRLESLDLILGFGGLDLALAQKLELAERKNGYYQAEIAHLGPNDLLPGAREALETVRRWGLKVALASASRNAPQILEKLGVAELFDAVAAPGGDRRGKPAPDLFLAAADLVGAAPARCLALEDSVAGLAAIRAAGMTAIGVGDPKVLGEADLVIPDLTAFRPERPGRTEPARDA